MLIINILPLNILTPNIPKIRKKTKHIIIRLNIYGIDIINESIASYNPWFLEINLSGLKSRRRRIIYNCFKIF